MCGLFTMIKWIFFFSIVTGISCLRLISLDVPGSVAVGERVRLTCVFELEGDLLYSVKWYRDAMEFYRYVPSDKPPGQFFPLQGIDVDIEHSNNGTVYLRDVSSSTAGEYRCEVSADAPSFQTVAADKTMTVYVNGAPNKSIQLSSFLATSLILLVIVLCC
ncbi:uncharacterized protein [Centruroides vittatus]|uniref:uncharacterized protein isoform X1 n=1 Tax=Centruroides vittatus TaxID=120091 RepID=UPI003510B728